MGTANRSLGSAVLGRRLPFGVMLNIYDAQGIRKISRKVTGGPCCLTIGLSVAATLPLGFAVSRLLGDQIFKEKRFKKRKVNLELQLQIDNHPSNKSAERHYDDIKQRTH